MWKVHVVEARGHTVIPSVERSLADRIVEAINEWSRLDGQLRVSPMARRETAWMIGQRAAICAEGRRGKRI
jgi:hypothetical protein